MCLESNWSPNQLDFPEFGGLRATYWIGSSPAPNKAAKTWSSILMHPINEPEKYVNIVQSCKIIIFETGFYSIPRPLHI